jgi:hypothetical protein
MIHLLKKSMVYRRFDTSMHGHHVDTMPFPPKIYLARDGRIQFVNEYDKLAVSK